MDEQINLQKRVKRDRKPKSKLQLFKENQLPMIIAGVTAVLLLIFVIGSISNGVKRAKLRKEEEKAAAEQMAAEKAALDSEVEQLLQQAETAAAQYDYDEAIRLLDSTAADPAAYPELGEMKDYYESEKSNLIEWSDPSSVVNLSFQMLVADPYRAFSHEEYGESFNKNYLTTTEFSAILTHLYQNGYVLVTTNDLFGTETADDGSIICTAKTLYLPADKKPIVITQTNVNYNYYLVDSDNDMLPDQNGCGFAHKLLIEGNKPVNEMINENGETVYGEYDLIPILDSFVENHPDFSYHGSKAVVAVSGYDGLFGYRTAAKDRERLAENYDYEVEQAKQVAQWLRNNGYALGCYTYRNTGYGMCSVDEIKEDLNLWNSEVVPILGEIDLLVYAQRSDIAGKDSYLDERYQVLRDQGFRFYLGFCEDGAPWASVTNNYIRQGRIMVAGATLQHHSNWFSGILDPYTILDPVRGDIPTW